jgi:uncharacterized phiE125 gp8 family phage protein
MTVEIPLTYIVNTAATDEPLTLDEIKEHLRVTHNEEDNRIAGLGVAARQAVEYFTRRQLMKATYDFTRREWPDGSEVVEIPKPPLQSLTVTYIDSDGNSQTLATTVYTVDTASEPGRFFLAKDQSWPDLEGAPNVQEITITAVCGYSAGTVAQQRAAVPDTIKEQIKILTEHLYDGKPITEALLEQNLRQFQIPYTE